MTQSPRPAHPVGPEQSSRRTIAVDVTEPELDADVRAVLAALALDPGPRDGAGADVVVTDRPDQGAGPGGARVVRVGADGARGDDDDDEVVRLPSGTADLMAVLMAPVAAARGSLVAVVGAVGGCGTSTLAAAIAVRAANSGRVLLVEADPRGTGVDLLLGAEAEPGLKVEDVRAELGGPDPGALWDAAPAVSPTCRVLARARGRGSAGQPGSGQPGSGLTETGLTETGLTDTGPAAAGSPRGPSSDGALGAALAQRSEGALVVCDAGRFGGDDPVLGRADLVVVVTRADLQGAVAAGRSTGDLRGAVLVVRTQRGDPLHPADVAESAGIPRWHALPEVRAVRRLAGSGDLGRALERARGGRAGRLSAVADAVLDELVAR